MFTEFRQHVLDPLPGSEGVDPASRVTFKNVILGHTLE